MSYAEMSSAFKAFDKSMEKVVAEAKGEVKEWLQIEKDAWVDMWSSVRDHPLIGKSGGWAILARYVDLLRHDYYDAPYGYRLDPATWQPDIMARVKMFLDFNSIIEASSSSSGGHQTGHGGNQQASSSSGKTSQKKSKAQGRKQPFSSGASTSPDGLGACFVCGSRVLHNINDCNRVPEGRETAHAKRDASRKLIRASDGTTIICHRFNLSNGCMSTAPSCSAGKHECSICGKTEHGCQGCPTVTKPSQASGL
ncbi:hypothetical protein A4X03_0g8172 [Tilletia caries]|uniref:Uncharacterized protein n=1 Tax=Tilletia caries TaxID=13290 RepID=A0A8T8SKX4_9BASI|nr:hypothetical protein A4X03_0g8172 [Tilletia caries]